jgi:hypothetical protein
VGFVPGKLFAGLWNKAAARWVTSLCTPLEAFFDALPVLASLQRPERLEANVKRIAILIATCLIPALLSAQEHSPTKMRANSRTSGEVILGERLAREYEKQSGLGSTPEFGWHFPIHKQCGKPGRERASIGSSVSFRVRPESGFQECFRTSARINHGSGGLLAIAQTEDERITGVSSGNSDPPHSGNSEPSSNSRKR